MIHDGRVVFDGPPGEVLQPEPLKGDSPRGWTRDQFQAQPVDGGRARIEGAAARQFGLGPDAREPSASPS